jgi:hypothetical protein
VNRVIAVFSDPSGRIVTMFADAPALTKSAFVVSKMRFPSGDQSCLIATSQEYGVIRWRPVPFGRTANSACCSCCFLMRTNEIHLPSGEKFGSVSHPHSPLARNGFRVSRRRPVPSTRMSQTPLSVSLASLS